MTPASNYEGWRAHPGTPPDLDIVVEALTAAGVDHNLQRRGGVPMVVVATRAGTDNWVEITRQGEGCYLTCGYTGGVADPDDATILAVGPPTEIPGVTAAWLGG